MTSFAEKDLSLVDFAAIVLERRAVVVRTAAAVAILVAIVVLALPRKYTSVGSFVPAGGDAVASRASGLAAQLGVALPIGAGGQSPDFYAELLQSHGVLGALAVDSIDMSSSPRWPWSSRVRVLSSVSEMLEVDESDPSARRDETVRALREVIQVNVAPLSGTVTVRASTNHAELSRFLVARLIDLVNVYNRSQRQSQARAEREFAEVRITEARANLAASEDSLRDFLVRNRSYVASPALQFEAERLQRDISQKQQVFLTLTDAFEQARMAEVRSTPVVSVVQQPTLPGLPDRRFLVLKSVLGLLVGAAAGSAVAVLGVVLSSGASAPVSGADRIRNVWPAVREDLRRPWRLIGGS